MSLAPGQVLELRVERPAFGGDVLARAADGRVVFFRGAAPGDRVEVRLVKVHRRHLKARLLRVVEPCEARAAPFCPHAASCGGCPWMAIPVAAQRAALEQHAARGLSRALGTPISLQSSPTTVDRAWRSTARLRWQGGALGFNAAAGGLVDVPQCPALAPPLPAMLRWARAALLPHLPPRGALRLSAAEGAPSGTLHLAAQTPPSAALVGALEIWPPDAAVHGVVLEMGGERRRFGRPFNDLGPLAVPHPAGSFMQAHQPGSRALVRQLLSDLGPPADRPLLELYAGSGHLSFALAGAGHGVVAVERDPAAAEALRAEAARRGLSARLRVHLGDARRPPAGDFAGVVLDPPREGGRAAVEVLAGAARLQRISYVSCDPNTLCRDLTALAAGGWGLLRAQAFHLFPHTGHVEVLAALTR